MEYLQYVDKDSFLHRLDPRTKFFFFLAMAILTSVIKSGVALVARLTEAPVLPCSVYWEGKLGFRRKIVIRYGELIPYEAMGLTESSSARELRNATQLLFGKVLESIEVSKNEY